MNSPTEPSDAIAQLIEHLRAGQKQLEELLTNGSLPTPLGVDEATMSILSSLSPLTDLSSVPGLEDLTKTLPDLAELQALLPTPEQLAAALPNATDAASPWPWPVASTPSPWPPPQRPSQTNDSTGSSEEQPARRRGTSATETSAPRAAPSMRRASAYPGASNAAAANEAPLTQDPPVLHDDEPPVAPVHNANPPRPASVAAPASERGALSRRVDPDEATLQAIDEELDDRVEAEPHHAEHDGGAPAALANLQALADQMQSATEALMRGRRP